MTADRSCAEIRDLIPELAVGVATGEERAAALQHLSRCVDCRHELERMSEVADELLLLAPEREPPPGFESRVLERVMQRKSRRWRPVAIAVAAAILLSALSAAAVYRTGDRDRRLAAQYERVLERFDGEYFQTAWLEGSPSGAKGQVFGYQGSPSWLFVIVPGEERPNTYVVTLETRSGERLALGSVSVDADGGSLGRTIPVDLGDIARLRMEDASDHALEAQWPHWDED